jgi:hypothetical protein
MAAMLEELKQKNLIIVSGVSLPSTWPSLSCKSQGINCKPGIFSHSVRSNIFASQSFVPLYCWTNKEKRYVSLQYGWSEQLLKMSLPAAWQLAFRRLDAILLKFIPWKIDFYNFSYWWIFLSCFYNFKFCLVKGQGLSSIIVWCWTLETLDTGCSSATELRFVFILDKVLYVIYIISLFRYWKTYHCVRQCVFCS